MVAALAAWCRCAPSSEWQSQALFETDQGLAFEGGRRLLCLESASLTFKMYLRLCQLLLHLRSALYGPPLTLHQAIATVKDTLGRPLGEVFSTISERPVAAASLGHRAVLRDTGEMVAIKVQRPGEASPRQTRPQGGSPVRTRCVPC